MTAANTFQETWTPFDSEQIGEEVRSGRRFWIATHTGAVFVGTYQWQQGGNPHGFNTEGAGRISADKVGALMPFSAPEHPAKAAAAWAQRAEGAPASSESSQVVRARVVVNVKLRAPAQAEVGVIVSEFIAEMDYSFDSNTDGVVVADTEVESFSINE